MSEQKISRISAVVCIALVFVLLLAACSYPSPVFVWKLCLGLPNAFVIEIDYLHDGSYMQTDAIIDRTKYRLPEELWEKIKSDAPVTNGKQEIRWRVRIDYVIHPEDGPYYTAWGTFWIT